MPTIERVCLVHNHYQRPGGEDTVFAAEAELLESRGIQVTRFTVHNDAVETMSLVSTAARTVWNPETRRALSRALRDSRSELVHFHNTFPLISPAGYAAATDVGVPVVQTLHNYRLVCANAVLFRDGRPCEDCVGRRFGWPGVLHACYRGSRAASATIATMTALHRAGGTYAKHVHAYIALNEFARSRFVRGGLPASRIYVKPNFVLSDPGLGDRAGDYALFVGRLAPEKGIGVVRQAWESIGERVRLKVAGDGPELGLLEGRPGIELLGHRSRADIASLMRGAQFLVFPTLVYEGFPLVLAEAFAAGLPVIASDRGAAATIVQPERSGVLFAPGDADALARAVLDLRAQPERLSRLRRGAREQYEAEYTADANFGMLMRIYEEAIRTKKNAA